ncbi:MAG TPA: RDD family protein, partial [Nitrososphaerales archaeon]|nr:RDD family protein [Nitrososphaerales archaeon]
KEVPSGATFCPSCGATLQAGATGGASAGSAQPVSGIDTLTKDQKAQQYWLERFFAFVIDAIIVYVILAVLTALIAIPALLTGGVALFSIVFGGVSVLWGLIFVFYFTLMESTSGASIGKRIFKLKAVGRSGSNPTIAEAFIRNISKIYWLLLLLDVIIGLAISKGYQQKYSDHFMGTSVVRP